MKRICDKKNPLHFPFTYTYSTVQYSAVQCSAVQCSAVQCSAVQCSAVQCSTVQCSTVKCSAVQYSSVQYRNNPMVWYRTKIYVVFSFFVCKTHSRLILHTSYYTLTCSISYTFTIHFGVHYFPTQTFSAQWKVRHRQKMRPPGHGHPLLCKVRQDEAEPEGGGEEGSAHHERAPPPQAHQAVRGFRGTATNCPHSGIVSASEMSLLLLFLDHGTKLSSRILCWHQHNITQEMG